MSQPIITRAEAKARGLSRYFTGKRCRWEHDAEQYVSGGCVVCAHLAYAKKAEKTLVCQYRECGEPYPSVRRLKHFCSAECRRLEKNAKCRDSYAKNPEKERTRRENSKEYRSAYRKEWYLKNRPTERCKQHNRYLATRDVRLPREREKRAEERAALKALGHFEATGEAI